MHGVRREHDAAKLEQKRQADEKRITAFREGIAEADKARAILKKDGSNENAQTLLKLTEVVLLMNPAHYTMWNMRKEALLVLGLQVATTLEPELRLTMKCLQMNPKVYCVWEHRRWCIEHCSDAPLKLPVLQKELLLCEKLHSLDARNFHCWNYRRWALDASVALGASKSTCDREDEVYTLRRLREDFSNYSAWHARAVCREREMEESKKEERNGTLSFLWWEGEWDTLFSALYTAPSDQSLWMYVYWMLWNDDRAKEANKKVYTDKMIQLAEHCAQLLDMDGEQNSKWVLLTMLRLLRDGDLKNVCEQNNKPLPFQHTQEQLKEILLKIDPMRQGLWKKL